MKRWRRQSEFAWTSNKEKRVLAYFRVRNSSSETDYEYCIVLQQKMVVLVILVVRRGRLKIINNEKKLWMSK
jgi:hypothetical protein